jgi:hypothetical protein
MPSSSLQEEFESAISEARRKTLDEMSSWREEVAGQMASASPLPLPVVHEGDAPGADVQRGPGGSDVVARRDTDSVGGAAPAAGAMTPLATMKGMATPMAGTKADARRCRLVTAKHSLRRMQRHVCRPALVNCKPWIMCAAGFGDWLGLEVPLPIVRPTPPRAGGKANAGQSKLEERILQRIAQVCTPAAGGARDHARDALHAHPTRNAGPALAAAAAAGSMAVPTTASRGGGRDQDKAAMVGSLTARARATRMGA